MLSTVFSFHRTVAFACYSGVSICFQILLQSRSLGVSHAKEREQQHRRRLVAPIVASKCFFQLANPDPRVFPRPSAQPGLSAELSTVLLSGPAAATASATTTTTTGLFRRGANISSRLAPNSAVDRPRRTNRECHIIVSRPGEDEEVVQATRKEMWQKELID